MRSSTRAAWDEYRADIRLTWSRSRQTPSHTRARRGRFVFGTSGAEKRRIGEAKAGVA
jgi:hypothetical protein